MRTDAPTNSLDEIRESIARAMSRVGAKKEADLCQYIPSSKGRLHHFVFGKLKKTQPKELLRLLKEHILEKEIPEQIPSSPRPFLKVKRTVDIKLKRSQINQLLSVLKNSGMQQGFGDLITILSPYQSLKQVQRLVIDMIKRKGVDENLWVTYKKLVEEEKAAAS